MFKSIVKQLFLVQMLIGSTAAVATTYNFTGLSISQQNLSNQLFVDVTAGTGVDTGSVLFKVTNLVGISSNVAEIYFDTDSGTSANRFFTGISILSQSGTSFGASTAVDFSAGANPPDLPGRPSTFESDFAFDNGNNNVGGLNEAEDFIIFKGVLGGISTYNDVLNALNTNDFEIGLHIRSIPGVNGAMSSSDSYITGGAISAVPLPAAGWLFGSALIGLMGLRRKMH